MATPSTRCSACGRAEKSPRHKCRDCGQQGLLGFQTADGSQKGKLYWHTWKAGQGQAFAELHICGLSPIDAIEDHCGIHVPGFAEVTEYEATPRETPNIATKPVEGPSGDGLGATLAREVLPYLTDLLDEDKLNQKVEDIATKVAQKHQPIRIEISRPEADPVEITGQHHEFASLMRLLAARLPVALVGPAGSGKTRAASAAAEALGLAFYAKSMGPTTTEFDLLGYRDASGNYVPGFLREPFEKGGVVLFDEMDASSAAPTVVLNNALGGREIGFPDGMRKAHPDWVAVAAMNTFGLGANFEYVGRQKMDAATRDRFMFLDWGYSPEIENAVMAKWVGEYGGTPPVDAQLFPKYEIEADRSDEVTAQRMKEYILMVKSIRKAADESGTRMIVGTRTLEMGLKAIAVGFTPKAVLEMKVWPGIESEARTKIESMTGAV